MFYEAGRPGPARASIVLVADPGVLSTVAAITVGFGIAVLFFRIDRELSHERQGRTDLDPLGCLSQRAAETTSRYATP